MVGLEIVMLSELSQTEKNQYYVISLMCRIEKKNHTNEPTYKTETVTDVEKKLMITKGCEVR